tara:strand:+ start:54 stop:587 length:534 start_codon:yes stop_codon:yes gene_type:complete
MPKFYRQNRKRIDPRYFLSETTNRDEDIEEAISSRFDGEMDAMGRINPGKDMMSDKSYASGYNSQSAAEDSIVKTKDTIEKKLQKMLDDGRSGRKGLEGEFAMVLDSSMAGDLTDEDIQILDTADNHSERALEAAVVRIFDKLKAGDIAAQQPGIDSDGDGIDDGPEAAIRNILDRE